MAAGDAAYAGLEDGGAAAAAAAAAEDTPVDVHAEEEVEEKEEARLVRGPAGGGEHLGAAVGMINGLAEEGAWWTRTARRAVALGAVLLVLAVAVGVPAERADEDDSKGESTSVAKNFSFFAFGLSVLYLCGGALVLTAVRLERDTFSKLGRALESVRTAPGLRWDCSEDAPEQWDAFCRGAASHERLGRARREAAGRLAGVAAAVAGVLLLLLLAAGPHFWVVALVAVVFGAAPGLAAYRSRLRRADPLRSMEHRPGAWGAVFHAEGALVYHHGALYWSERPFARVGGCSFVYGDEKRFRFASCRLGRDDDLGGCTLELLAPGGKSLALLPVPNRMAGHAEAFLRQASLLEGDTREAPRGRRGVPPEEDEADDAGGVDFDEKEEV